MPSARCSAVSSSSSGASTPLRGSNRSQLSSYEQRRKRSARNSGWSSGTHSTQASSPKPNRCLVISDDDLETLADETSSTIQWEQILDATSRWKWKESVKDFSIYTKQDGQRYAVLAVGVLPCSVAELRVLMHAARNEEHIRCMDALHGSHFREGEVVHNVDLCTDDTRPVPLGRASAPLVQLSVKTATFNKTNWLSSHEEWCYIDAVYDDRSDYSNVVIRSLRVPKVVPNRQNDKPAEAALSELLHDALYTAPTKCKKERVMNVIKHMISTSDVESTPSSPCSAVTALFATHSSDPDFSHALEKQLKVDSIPDEDDQFANTDERKYQVNPGQDVEVQMTYPVPNNEEQRLRLIKESRICEMGKIDELDIICNIAAKEVDCLASLVTIIGKRDVYIAASSMEALQQKTLPRADVFCAHSIMDTKPFVLPHPEADVRFHKASPVFDLSARFYCGFPLLAGDDSTVIGSVCCIDTKSRELTEAQYTSLSKLAATASKVVKLQTLQRRNSASEQLRTYDSEPPLARHS
ncbi:hypothetical protein Poli38472_004632 [Pythium oligandrum]|uniref:GAF domain-containing protein n=1 Tax=Pythium oligandrum TaxID=41045 RepID=A0A8K1FIB1_PYTOL|nr:hypothetical protein Poli38472_004632 [Pythium oligandrum]|eukprot:TMW59563.1 hypothetical protein Poli38472_004632 [Pythium oligandrum]